MAEQATQSQGQQQQAAGTATAGNTNADQPAADQPNNDGINTVTVDKSEFEALKSGFVKMEHTLNGLAAEKRLADKKAKETRDAAAAEKAEGQLTLKSLKDELEADRTAARQEFLELEMGKFEKEAGISEDQAPFFEAFVEKKYGAQLTVKGRKVFFEDETGELQPFSVLGKKVMATPGGKAFLAPVSTPGEVGNRNQQGVNRHSAGGKPIQQMSAEDMRKDPSGALQGLRELALLSQSGSTTRS
jgi:hypothetical protein